MTMPAARWTASPHGTRQRKQITSINPWRRNSRSPAHTGHRVSIVSFCGRSSDERRRRSDRDLTEPRSLTVCGGSGMDAEFLAREGARVVASDLSLGAARRTRERARRYGLDITPIVADVERLPFADGTFDLVLVHDGLHHLERPELGLAEMARVARQWVSVTEPARATITAIAVRAGLALDREEAGNAVARLSTSEVVDILRSAGFRPLVAKRYAMYYKHEPGTASRALSRRPIFPLVRASWQVANKLIGWAGNKMVVVAERSPLVKSTRHHGHERGQQDSETRVPLTVLLPVLNEEKNLPAALQSVRWADEIVLVDSHSSDRTAAIAMAYGALVVQFTYDGVGPKKKGWALQNLAFRNEWVLILDADERVTEELRGEIEHAITTGTADGYCLDREFVFMGRSLRCFRPNWNVRLFRHRVGRMEDMGLTNLPGTGDNEIHEHVQVDGELGFLKNPLLHDDYRGISPWIDRHNRYATWEAHLYMKFQDEPIGISPMQFLRLDPFHRKRVLRRVWARLPFRPFLRFVVWYFFRLGILDGRQGYVFCLLMAWYELLVGLKIDELKKARRRLPCDRPMPRKVAVDLIWVA